MAHPSGTDRSADVRLEIMTDAKDIPHTLQVQGMAFGDQTSDGVWLGLHPNWQTPEGSAAIVKKYSKSFDKASYNKDGQPICSHVKAIVKDPATGQDKIVGYTIWTQYSNVDGYGCPVGPWEDMDLLYPGDERGLRYAEELRVKLQQSRKKAVDAKATADPPALYICDCCAVDPAYQGRGIARKLIQWGVDEAKNRGNLDCAMEASIMGRRVYGKMGFDLLEQMNMKLEGEFADRVLPDTVWMVKVASAE